MLKKKLQNILLIILSFNKVYNKFMEQNRTGLNNTQYSLLNSMQRLKNIIQTASTMWKGGLNTLTCGNKSELENYFHKKESNFYRYA